MLLAAAIKKHKENQGFGPWEPHGGVPRGCELGSERQFWVRKHQKCSEAGRRASVWRDIRTTLILWGLQSLWDASRAPKRPKMAP